MQIELGWAQLPALAELRLMGVQLTDTVAAGFSELQQLSSLELNTWGDGEEELEGAQQSAIAHLLRASPPALRSLELELRDEGGGTVAQFQSDLAAAVGGLTQLRQLSCEDLGVACQLSQLRELRHSKTWSSFSIADLIMLRALRGLTRLELHPKLAWGPRSADLRSGVEQVRWAWASAHLRQQGLCRSHVAGCTTATTKTCRLAALTACPLCCVARRSCGACCQMGASSGCEGPAAAGGGVGSLLQGWLDSFFRCPRLEELASRCLHASCGLLQRMTMLPLQLLLT